MRTLLRAGGLCTVLLWVYVEQMKAQPIVKVNGTLDTMSVKKQVIQHLKHLDIRESVFISVSFLSDMPEKKEGLTILLPTVVSGEYQIIKVWIDKNVNDKRRSLVLAHEMIHVKQFVKGELILVDDQHAIWQGKRYTFKKLPHMRLAPWEVEAYKKDASLAKLFTEETIPLLTEKLE